MNTTTFFLVFCLTIVILGITISPGAADDNTTTVATTVPTTTVTIVATTVPTTTETTVATTTTALPTVTSISPSTGSLAGGGTITIYGTGFSNDLGGVTFGSIASTSFNVISDTEVTAPAPADATAGTVDVTVITDSGTSSTSIADEYTYSATATTTVPVVSGISPSYGPVSVNTPITITGTGFTGATSVTIGGTAASSFTVVSDTQITASTPASSTAGQVDVTVTTPSGPSSTVAADSYTFAEAATTIPLPIFYASPTSGTAPLLVTFTDESTGSPASWSWSFGDGNTSTLENPSYTYVNNGTYPVTLTEENSVGENTTTVSGYIVVGPAVPVAGYSASPTSGTEPLTVQFTDTSTGSPTSWLWAFGDGTTSSEESPSHVYTRAGTFTVSLIASNDQGSNTFSQPAEITVLSGTAVTATYTLLPTASYTYAIPSGKQAASESSNAAWLDQENKKMAAMDSETPANSSDLTALIPLVSLICGVLFFRKIHP